jgi:acetyltransferase-like isoleucine patch superfamily enzyme
MGAGLFLYDVIYVLLASLAYGAASLVALRTHSALTMWMPWWLALFPAFYVAILSLIAQATIACFVLPKLKPGRYTMMKGSVFYGWLFRAMVRRILFLPGVRWVLFASNTLRFLALRGMGAKVAYTTNMSADVELLDPWLLVAGPGATIGARCGISGHYVERGKLLLDYVHVGAGSLLSAEVGVAPGCKIGARVMVKARATLGVNVTIGDDAIIGASSYVDTGAKIGNGARVLNCAHIGARAKIADHSVIAADARASSTMSSADPAV